MTFIRIQSDIIRADEIAAISMYQDDEAKPATTLQVWFRHHGDTLEYEFASQEEAERVILASAMILRSLP